MLATLREHAPGERDPAVVAGLVAWASGAFAGADALGAAPTLSAPGGYRARGRGPPVAPGRRRRQVLRAARGLDQALPPLDADHDARMPRLIWRSAGRPAGAGRTSSPAPRAARPTSPRWRRVRRPPSTPAPTPAPAPASPHVAEAPAPASLHVAEAPAPAQGMLARGAGRRRSGARGGAPAVVSGARGGAPPAAGGGPRVGHARRRDQGRSLPARVSVRGLSSGASASRARRGADAPYVDTAACIEPRIVLEVRGDDYRRALGAEHLRRVRSCRRESSFGISDRSSIGVRVVHATRRQGHAAPHPCPCRGREARRSCDTVAFRCAGRAQARGRRRRRYSEGTRRSAAARPRLHARRRRDRRGSDPFPRDGDDDSAEHVARSPTIVFRNARAQRRLAKLGGKTSSAS